MDKDLCLSYKELIEHFQGQIGTQVRRLALQSSAMAAAEQVEYRGERITSVGGRVESIAMLAIQDFLDLCFEENKS